MTTLNADISYIDILNTVWSRMGARVDSTKQVTETRQNGLTQFLFSHFYDKIVKFFNKCFSGLLSYIPVPIFSGYLSNK